MISRVQDDFTIVINIITILIIAVVFVINHQYVALCRMSIITSRKESVFSLLTLSFDTSSSSIRECAFSL